MQSVLLSLAFLGITVSSALGTPSPPIIYVTDRVVLVQVEGERLIVKIQTRSNPKRYSSRDVSVAMGMFSEDAVVVTRCISKQYLQDSMFVIELYLPRITYQLRSFDWISITLLTPKIGLQQIREVYKHRSDKPIYEGQTEPNTPPPPIVRVDDRSIIIKVQTRFKLEQYKKKVVKIRFFDNTSKLHTWLGRTEVSKQYVCDGMFVIEVNKFMVTRGLAGFTDVEVTLEEKCGDCESYTYESDDLISLIGDVSD
jgi:hypothetical protein